MSFTELAAGLDWSPLWISLKTGVVATIISFFLGLWAARKVIKKDYRAKSILDGILTLPMVLPPTVAGFFLLLIFSRRRTFGIFLDDTFDIQVVHTWLGCIIAATVIAFPLMYRNASRSMPILCMPADPSECRKSPYSGALSYRLRDRG